MATKPTSPPAKRFWPRAAKSAFLLCLGLLSIYSTALRAEWVVDTPIPDYVVTVPEALASAPVIVALGATVSVEWPYDFDVDQELCDMEPVDFATDTVILTWSGAVGTVSGDGCTFTLDTSEAGVKTFQLALSDNGPNMHADDDDVVLTFEVTVVEVASVTCGSVTSTTDTPGDDETVNVSVGYTPVTNGPQALTFTATPYPSGDWPVGEPHWSGVSSATGATATLSTATVGAFTVTASCGTSSKSITVNVVGVQYVKARRKGTGDTYTTSSAIATGAIANDVHIAELAFKLNPIPKGTFSIPIDVTVTNTEGYPDGSPIDAVLTVSGSSVSIDHANDIANITFTQLNTSTTTGIAAGTLTSSDRCTASGSPCTVGGASILFLWDCSGEYDFQYPPYFATCAVRDPRRPWGVGT